jgi:hypothetical protein
MKPLARARSSAMFLSRDREGAVLPSRFAAPRPRPYGNPGQYGVHPKTETGELGALSLNGKESRFPFLRFPWSAPRR